MSGMSDTDADTEPGVHRINSARWPKRITVACANFSSLPHQKEASLTKLIAVTRDAAARGADLVVFPELAINTWGTCPDCAAAQAPCEWHLREAERAAGPSAQRVAQAAAELGVHVIYGFEESGNRPGVIHNSANLVGPEGLIGTYRKLHLGIPLETNRFTPGDSLPVFDTALGPIGISICYDFYNNPELSRLLCLKGARLLVNPTGRSDLPHARENLTHATLVRAQENLVYAASSNRAGDTHDGSRWAGGSVIGGPDFPGFGLALATAGAEEELILAELDFDRAARWHDWLPWTEWRLAEQRPITELVAREFAALLDGGK
jgi:predicted amidohydrolase